MALCLVLWFYTIEPPFYAGLNHACRTGDEKFVEMLGPLAQCLYWIVARTESKRTDQIVHGQKILHANMNQPPGFFCSSFLLFRGTTMKEHWIDGWKEEVGKCG